MTGKDTAPLYTVGGLLAALKPRCYVHQWCNRAYARWSPVTGDPVWYDQSYQMHKGGLIDALKQLDPALPCTPYYITQHEFRFGYNDVCVGTARNVYIGKPAPLNDPLVIQHGDVTNGR